MKKHKSHQSDVVDQSVEYYRQFNTIRIWLMICVFAIVCIIFWNYQTSSSDADKIQMLEKQNSNLQQTINNQTSQIDKQGNRINSVEHPALYHNGNRLDGICIIHTNDCMPAY